MDLLTRFKYWYRLQPAAIRWLLTINVVLYLVWNLVLVHIGVARGFTREFLSLHPNPETILLAPWQLVTYNFLHTGSSWGGLFHILFNMLWLVWIGRDHENLHGSADLMGLYLLGGVGGGLMSILLHTAFPAMSGFSGPIVGASAAVLAIMAAVATRYPNKSIGLIFIGVVPLRLIILAFLFFDLLFIASSGTAVGAHLGGAVTGFAIARLQMQGRNVTGWARVFFGGFPGRSGGSRSASAPRGGASGRREMLEQFESWLEQRQARRQQSRGENPDGGRRSARIHRLDPASKDQAGAEDKSGRSGKSGRGQGKGKGQGTSQTGDDVIDRLLDKINEHGYESLSDEEKRILYEASNR